MGYWNKKLNKKLEIIKVLHESTKYSDLEDLIECNGKDLDSPGRTLRNYKKEGDIEIGNVVIPYKIIEARDGGYLSNSEDLEEAISYSDVEKRSSVHPVILPLNLSEVYLLTAGILKNLGRNHPKYDEYWQIGNKIYSQLSDYGKNIVNRANIDFEELETVTYTKEAVVNRNTGSSSRTLTNEEVEEKITTLSKANIRVGLLLADDEWIYGKFNYRNSMLYFETDYGDMFARDTLNIKNIIIM